MYVPLLYFSSCLGASSFALEVLFLLHTALSACHAIHDCLSYTEFTYSTDLILNVLLLIFLECVCSFCIYVSFCISWVLFI